MNRLLALSLASVLVFFSACQPKEEASLNSGHWRATLDLNGHPLSFDLELLISPGTPTLEAIIINGEEQITIPENRLTSDSLILRLPVFNTEIKASIIQGDSLHGFFYDYSRPNNYKIPFTAIYGDLPRFAGKVEGSPIEVGGKWEAVFGIPEIQTPAIGIFEQEGHRVMGTFLTETGDYRYLDGIADHEQLRLSAFDGSHVFLFEATLEGDSLKGSFLSGTHWEERWVAEKNPEASLRDPDSLAFLKEGFESLSFTFPDLDSNMVSLTDPQYQDKVVIVQLMGSWCPNCMDETRFLSEIYDQYHEEGLEIIALAYERLKNFDQAVASVKRMKDHFNTPYPFLIAGSSSKTEAAETLPMLNTVLAFPTTIFVDRNGRVRKVHTGFRGPGTGKFYHQFVDQTKSFLDKLLSE